VNNKFRINISNTTDKSQ